MDSNYSIKIQPLEERIKEDDNRIKDIRLVSLFGNTKGDLQWRINQYRDGSGSWDSVAFFETEEEAALIAKELIEKIILEKGSYYPYSNIKELNEKYNFKSAIINACIKEKKEKIKEIY